MKKLFLFLVLFSLFGQAQNYTGVVVSIKDGDTFVVLDSTKTQKTVRLAGVDAPEKKQDFGSVANKFVSEKVFQKLVSVVVIGKDFYNRPVGWIYYDVNNLSEELLKAGLAWHYKQYDKSKYLQSLQDIAQKNKAGLFADPRAIPPWEFRKLKKK
jgi:micrococcal nuclease